MPYDSKTFEKRTTDEAGHIVADRFGGSPYIDNIVSQDKKLNHGDYHRLEQRWATAIDEGRHVDVDIRILYEGESKRPIAFVIDEMIGGEFKSYYLENGLDH